MMSVMSQSTSNLYPQARTNNMSIEKKAWFLCKILCNDLSGSTFSQIRSQLDKCKGIKTRVKLNGKGLKVGSKMNLNPRVLYELYPFDCIDRILQDLHYINVVFIILRMDLSQSNIHCGYEVIAYKFKAQNYAFRFQDVFNNLSGTKYDMERTMSRPELNLSGLHLMPAKDYHMGLLATDRWSGPQGPRSEISYGRRYNNTRPTSPARSIKMNRTIALPATVYRSMHDERSDIGSLDSSENGTTTTFREVAVSANLPPSDRVSGRPVLRSETNYRNIPNVSDTWCQADTPEHHSGRSSWQREAEARVIVNPHHHSYMNVTDNAHHFGASSVLSNDSRMAASSVDDSGFYGGPEVAVAYVNGSKNHDSFDVVDGTVSVRKTFNKQTRHGAKANNFPRGSSNIGAAVAEDQYYQYRNISAQRATGMGKKARSVGHLGPNGVIYMDQPTAYRQMPPPVSRGPSRSDLYNDNASVVSQGSVYLLNPKFRKTYLPRDVESSCDPRFDEHY